MDKNEVLKSFAQILKINANAEQSPSLEPTRLRSFTILNDFFFGEAKFVELSARADALLGVTFIVAS